MGPIDTPDRPHRRQGIARFAWRALFVCAFAALALLAANGPASAEDCAADDAECAAAGPTEPGTVGDDDAQTPPSSATDDPAEGHSDDAPGDRDQAGEHRSPQALVADVVRPTVERILELPGKLAARPAPRMTHPDANPVARPVIDETDTPTPATDPAAPAPTTVRVPSPVVDEDAPESALDLVVGLTHDIARAPSGVVTRIDDTITSLDQRRSPSPDRSTAAEERGLLSVTRTIAALLPVLDLEGTVSPILAALPETLTRPLSPVTPVLDAVLVPVLAPTVERTARALNPEGHDRSDSWQAQVETDSPVATTPVPTTTSVPVAGVTPTRLVGTALGAGGVSATSQSTLAPSDPLVDAAQVTGDVPDPVSDATAPAPGANDGDGSGVQGAGGSGGSSADLGKVLIGALKLPGNSRPVGVPVDSWRLPDSLGSEPGHSPA